MNEKPDTVHGRLLEAVHISGYSFERAYNELKWLLVSDKWEQCGDGFEQIDDFLRTINFKEFKITVEKRKEMAKILADKRATQRAIGGALGVNEATINRDLNPVASATKQDNQVKEYKELENEIVANARANGSAENTCKTDRWRFTDTE